MQKNLWELELEPAKVDKAEQDDQWLYKRAFYVPMDGNCMY